jgi:hypothetical protein
LIKSFRLCSVPANEGAVMKKLAWEKGLFRVYLLLNVIGIVFAFISIGSVAEAWKLGKEAEELCQKVEEFEKLNPIVIDLYRANRKINVEELEQQLKEKGAPEWYIQRAATTFGVVSETNTLDIVLGRLPPKEVETLFLDGVDYVERQFYKWKSAKTYREEKTRDLLLSLTGGFTIAPWILHYSIKWLLEGVVLPILRWVWKGFSAE